MVKPADIIEEIWVRDFVDCDWDVRRYRRLKDAHMAATAYEGLRKVLDPISFKGWLELVEDWAARKPEAIEEVNPEARRGRPHHRCGHGPDALRASR
jgi:hypothetical protein